jgi:serine protease SohB
LRSTLRDRFGDKVKMPLVAVERGLFGRRIPGLDSWAQELRDGSALAGDILSAIEARAWWARYGL